MTRKYLFTIIAIVVLVGLGGVYFSYKKSSFELMNPKQGPIEEAIYGLGTVKSFKIYEHKLGVITNITRLWVKEGDHVKKGQLVMEFSEGFPLRAPFDGTITTLPFHEKENIFPQIPIARIEDLKDLYVEVALEQQGALRVRSGQMARLSFESMRGSSYEGKVESLYPFNGQFLVRIRTEKIPEGILPGMTADVAIQVSRRENALSIPVRAVANGAITVLRQDKKERLNVQVGLSDGEWIELIEPQLSLTEEIVVPRK